MKGMKHGNRQFMMTFIACLGSPEKNIHEILTSEVDFTLPKSARVIFRKNIPNLNDILYT